MLALNVKKFFRELNLFGLYPNSGTPKDRYDWRLIEASKNTSLLYKSKPGEPSVLVLKGSMEECLEFIEKQGPVCTGRVQIHRCPDLDIIA